MLFLYFLFIVSYPVIAKKQLFCQAVQCYRKSLKNFLFSLSCFFFLFSKYSYCNEKSDLHEAKQHNGKESHSKLALLLFCICFLCSTNIPIYLLQWRNCYAMWPNSPTSAKVSQKFPDTLFFFAVYFLQMFLTGYCDEKAELKIFYSSFLFL